MRLHSKPAKGLPTAKFLFASIFIGLISTIIFSQETSASNVAADIWEVEYQIDRSQVPDLFYKDLTINIDIGFADSVFVEIDGSAVDSTYNSGSGIVEFTTSGSDIYLQINGAEEASMPPVLTKASLLQNKKWAWSHGFDDNVDLKPSIAAFNARGWQATVFMITSEIHETRQEDWIVDKPDLLNYIANGWGVGSHGHMPTCNDYNTADQLTALDKLAGIVDDSAIPNYKITSFAVPCFRNEYVPVIMGIIQSGSRDLQFYETGNDYLRIVDTAYIRPHGSNNIPSFSSNNITARGLELNGPLGRDFRIENDSDIAVVKAQFDWMADNATANRHFWYNTLAHGDHENSISEAINHVYNTYGPNGSDEAWVAPSDKIYSYILVRDNSQTSMASIKKNGVGWSVPTTSPSPTQTVTQVSSSTPIPTQTNTAVPTQTDTPQPTHTHTPIPTETNTLTPTQSPTATSTRVDPPTETPTQTFIPIVTHASTATSTRANTPAPTKTQTPLPTHTYTPLPTQSQTPYPSQTAAPTQTYTPFPTQSQTPYPSQTAAPTYTNTPFLTQTQTLVPTLTHTPTSVSTIEPLGCNLLQNGSFENGISHWERHGTLTLRSDAFHLDQALQVAKGWTGQKVIVTTGENLLLTGQFKSPNITGWTGIGIDYLNSEGEKIDDTSLKLSGKSHYQPFSLELTIPNKTTELLFWINSASGGEIIVDFLELEKIGCKAPNPTPRPTTTPTLIATEQVSSTPAPLTPTATPSPLPVSETVSPTPSPEGPTSEISYSIFFPFVSIVNAVK